MQNYPRYRCASRAKLLVVASLALYFSTTAPLTAAGSSGSIVIEPSSLDSPLPAGVDSETGYRMNRYRRPVPSTNPGTEVVNTPRALELHASGEVVFVDVFPPVGLGANPMDGTWLTNETHESIADATWLPEVGRGFIEQEHIDYFQRNLELLTKKDKQTPLLFFCTADCWQSWNAARRARLWGYENIFWYPAGTDGWVEDGYPVVPVEPVNFFGE